MRVLILGGGGTLGAFSAGALRALDAAGWRPDAAIGSSAGSINLLRRVAGGVDEPARFWTGLNWRALALRGLQHNVLRKGLLAPEDFYARVEQGVDFGAMLAEKRTVGFIVVDLCTGKVTVRGNRTESDAASLRAVSRASYALPPLLPPVKLGECTLADGGFLHNAPLEAALAMGATEVLYLCNVQVLPSVGWETASTLRSVGRYVEIFFRRASNVGFADAQVMGGRYHGVPFLTIAPPRSVRLRSVLGWMLPTPRNMSHLVRFGEAYARDALCVAAAEREKLVGRQRPAFARTGVGS